MTYFGCATRGNKIKWASFLIYLLVGVALIVAAIAVAASNVNDYQDCLKKNRDQGLISEDEYDKWHDHVEWSNDGYGDTGNEYVDSCQQSNLEDHRHLVQGLFLAGIILVALSIIPLLIMCCCTSSPEHTHKHVVAEAVPYGTAATYQAPYGTAATYQPAIQGTAPAPIQASHQPPYQAPNGTDGYNNGQVHSVNK